MKYFLMVEQKQGNRIFLSTTEHESEAAAVNMFSQIEGEVAYVATVDKRYTKTVTPSTEVMEEAL